MFIITIIKTETTQVYFNRSMVKSTVACMYHDTQQYKERSRLLKHATPGHLSRELH